MPTHYFSISVPTKLWMGYYNGDVRTVVITTTRGVTVALPAFRLRPFTTSAGLHGSFKLVLNDRNGFVSLKQVKGRHA